MNDTAAVLILRLRPARIKARATAEAEALHVLKDLGAERAAGGPLSEQAGVFWITVPTSSVERAAERLPLLGYAYAVDFAKPVRDRESPSGDVVVWRRRVYQLVRLYEESAEVARDRAPDRRIFALETGAGIVRPIRGYRGDSRRSKRRGLPSYDARMLVNLAAGAGGGVLVDPFAGAGGLVIEGVVRGCRVVSCDADCSLRYGLTLLGASHVVADARRMPFATATIDALATEPPYEPEVTRTVIDSLHEGARVLRKGGRIAMLCAGSQSNALRRAAMGLPLALLHEEALDRKGLECTILAWKKLKSRIAPLAVPRDSRSRRLRHMCCAGHAARMMRLR